MDSALNTPPLPCSWFGCRVIGTSDFDYVAFCIFDNFLTLNNIGVFQAHLSSRFESEIFFRRLFHKVIPFNIYLSGERNLAGWSLRSSRIQWGIEPFYLSLLPIGYGDLDRVLNYHIPIGTLIEVLTHAPFHKLEVNQLLSLGNSDLLGEHTDGLRCIATAANTADGRHSRIIPAAYEVVLHEFEKLALAHYRVSKIEAGKLILV